MATVISKDDYYTVSHQLAVAKGLIEDTNDYLFEAVYQVVILDDLYPEVDLLNAFWDAYRSNTAVTLLPNNYVEATRAMQKHVLKRGGFANVDEYLVNNALGATLKVDQEWADLSQAAGYPISSAYIL
jgi:hypothetical protein